ncbi:MAG: hypothetical protein EP330_14970 [Deltaproteobacteria bacterium]|nr:MAG: hypothetical protein EP330_14970 [Deltaproteobacteria bacterium]
MRLLLFLIACGGKPASTPATAVAEVACSAEDPSAWEGCVGQRVRLEGQRPDVVYEHPILGDPQDYFQVGERQIVVLGTVEDGCTAMSGVLDRVDMGGEPGTRGSYRGWVLRDATCD